MSNMDSDRGIDRTAEAQRSNTLGEEAAYRRAMAPMTYQVAYYAEDESVQVATFRCAAPQRHEMIRELCGIDPENVPIARRCMSHETSSTWSPAMGDTELAAALNSRSWLRYEVAHKGTDGEIHIEEFATESPTPMRIEGVRDRLGLATDASLAMHHRTVEDSNHWQGIAGDARLYQALRSHTPR